MRHVLLYFTIYLTLYSNTFGQKQNENYFILTVKEEFKSNGNINNHYFISSDSTITSTYQFNELYFSLLIDLSLKRNCARQDTVHWTRFFTIFTSSVVKDFVDLEKIVQERSVLIGTSTTDKTKIELWIASVSGQFCHCFSVNDNGAISRKYLPISGFMKNTDNRSPPIIADFDSFWKKYKKD